jgi:uncharacterized protein YndB with AHSA1/START domain
VWRAWTDPDELARWFPDRVRGAATPGTTMTYEWDALAMRLELEVVEAVPEAKLVLHAQPPGLEPQTQTIALARSGDETLVTLRHSGFDDDDILAGTESGWRITLQIMKHYLEHHRGSSRVNAWMIGLAPASFDSVYRRYSEPEGLREWLARRGSIGATGEDYAIDLIDGGTMSGQVLARSEGREVALSWSEINGVVAFRTFAAATGAVLVGANLSSWGVPEHELVPAAEALKHSINRLVRALGGSSATA